MKKYLILIFITCYVTTYSQNNNPTPLKFDFKTASGIQKTNEELKYEYFPNDEFMIGWQWGGNPKIAQELQTNFIQGSWFEFEGKNNHQPVYKRFKSSMNNVYKMSENTHSYRFEPTLKNVNPWSDSEYQERDGEKSIFGFFNINGTILSNPSDINYKRLILKKDSLNTYQDSIVLSGNWYPELFHNSSEDWYLSVNLRRLDTLNNIKNTNKVLTIQIEYFLTGDTTRRYIKFYKKPKLDSIYRIEHTNYRGHSYHVYEDVGNYEDKLTISREMIPSDFDTLSNDITISSLFTTENILSNPFDNPIFSKGESSKIDSFNIIAKYHGEMDIAVDWIRVENTLAFELFRGIDDIEIHDFVQEYIDTVEAGNVFKFFRLYNYGGDDAVVPFAWESFNYHNKLLNGLTIASRPSVLSTLQNFYIGSYEVWTTGNNFRGAGSRVSSPYWQAQTLSTIRTTSDFHPGTSLLGHHWYSLENGGDRIFPDTLNSFYETSFLNIVKDGSGNYLPIHSAILPSDTNFLEDLRGLPFVDYLNHFNEFTNSTLPKLELQSLSNYLSFPNRLFSNNPWWAQLFVVSNWKATYDPIYTNPYIPIVDTKNHAPETGEQIRFLLDNAIIWGAKGFMYDRLGSSHNYLSPNATEGDKISEFRDLNKLYAIGVSSGSPDSVNSSLTGIEYLNQDGLGGDFINTNHEPNNINYYMDFDSISHYMKVPQNRIFLGRKSQRREMFKIHSIVNNTCNELLSLRLQAGYIKSFRDYYVQHPDITEDTVINRFISIDSTNFHVYNIPKSTIFKPRPLEPFVDSTFFDVTLLKHEDSSLDSVFYIGIQNRRTDPMIKYINPLNSSDKYLRFLTTAELEDYCINGGESQTASYWQDYYWKRLGTREIEIPFNYTYSDSSDYKLLRISELDSESGILDSAWYFNEPFNNRVRDTVIGQNRSLFVKLLPGQGKILKVEVLKPGITAGILDNYNQTNLIEFPDPANAEKSIFHLVYYKKTKVPTDTTKRFTEVEYIRSMPIAKNSLEENIVWDISSKRNVSAPFLTSLFPVGPKYVDCNHPSIVVRKNSSGIPYAYIVYTCKDSNATAGDSARVIEAKINIVSKNITSNKLLYRLSTNNIEKFGTPVQNASANGNYIAWTDSLNGLFIAYQTPNSNIPIAVDSIKINEFPGVNHKPHLYPSFNTYSHIANGENNAALVWSQEINGTNGVFYSRIYFDDDVDTLIQSIPSNYVGAGNFTTDINNKFAKISSTDIATKPIVFRDLGSYSVTNPFWCIYNRHDNINWINKKDFLYLPFSETTINGITINHRDTNHINDEWGASKKRMTWFAGNQFSDKITSINSAQQDGITVGGNEISVAGNYNLDYTVDSTEIYQIPGYNGSNFLSYNEVGWIASYPNSFQRRASSGRNVQLAKSQQPNYDGSSNMWRNRRVFESSDEDSIGNPIIKSSSNLFYKTYANEVVTQTFFGFTGDSNNIYFDLPKLEGEFGSVTSRPYIFEPYLTFNPCDLMVQPDDFDDSFITKGITLIDHDNDGDKEIEISLYGYKDTNVRVILERNSDSLQVTLTMPPITTYPVAATKLIYSIIDSSGSTFNLIYQNKDTTAHYNEQSFVGGLNNSDTISYKSAIEKDPVKYIIDFNNGGVQYELRNINDFELTVYPNPTSGNLRVQAFLPEKLDGYKIENRSLVVSLYDATGRKVTSQNGATGQMFEFDLTSMPSGAYIINVEHTEGNKKYSATERIVKE